MASRVITVVGTPIEEDTTVMKTGEAIKPGHLIVFDSTPEVIKHATAAGSAPNMFALERTEGGQNIDTAYANGDRVKIGWFASGAVVNAFVPDGANLVKGEALESAGDGTLRTQTADAATDDTQRGGLVAYSDESTGGAVTGETRHKVRIA